MATTPLPVDTTAHSSWDWGRGSTCWTLQGEGLSTSLVCEKYVVIPDMQGGIHWRTHCVGWWECFSLWEVVRTLINEFKCDAQCTDDHQDHLSTVLSPVISIGVYYSVVAYFGQFLHTHVSHILFAVTHYTWRLVFTAILFCVAIFRQAFAHHLRWFSFTALGNCFTTPIIKWDFWTVWKMWYSGVGNQHCCCW